MITILQEKEIIQYLLSKNLKKICYLKLKITFCSRFQC